MEQNSKGISSQIFLIISRIKEKNYVLCLIIITANNSIINSIKETPIYYLNSLKAFYQGFWNNGLPHGEGRILYPDGSYYEGRIVNGELDTGKKNSEEGIYIFKDSSYYIGGFKNSKFSGKGNLVTINEEMSILGEFK
jgi:hypothetical protein